jgi:hypothetical protein
VNRGSKDRILVKSEFCVACSYKCVTVYTVVFVTVTVSSSGGGGIIIFLGRAYY